MLGCWRRIPSGCQISYIIPHLSRRFRVRVPASPPDPDSEFGVYGDTRTLPKRAVRRSLAAQCRRNCPAPTSLSKSARQPRPASRARRSSRDAGRGRLSWQATWRRYSRRDVSPRRRAWSGAENIPYVPGNHEYHDIVIGPARRLEQSRSSLGTSICVADSATHRTKNCYPCEHFAKLSSFGGH